MATTTTKVATNNIFASLNDDSDNEAPVKVAATTKVQAAETKGNQVPPTKNPRGARRDGNNDDHREAKKENNQRPKHTRDGPKEKGVPAEPHPQDRKSGTGISGVEKKFRKDGGGRGNYGTIKNEVDEINKKESTGQKQEEAPVVAQEPQVPVEPEVVDNTITVDEYFRRLGVTEEAPVEKAPERKLNLDELKREKLQVVSSKTDKVLDQNIIKVATSKKNKGPTTYLLGCNSDHSELLGVKTGHTLVKFVVDKDGKEVRPENTENRAPREPREPRDQKEQKEPREPREPKEHREPREPRDPKEQREPREPKEHREPRGPRDTNQNKEQRGPRDNNNRVNKPQQGGHKSKNATAFNETDFPSLS